MLHPFPLRRFIWIVVAGILTGALYAGVQYGTPMPGAVAGGSIAATLFALERFVLRRNAGGLLVADPPLQGSLFQSETQRQSGAGAAPQPAVRRRTAMPGRRDRPRPSQSGWAHADFDERAGLEELQPNRVVVASANWVWPSTMRRKAERST
jgi:hypothetical protein